MRRTRVVGLTALATAATLVLAACGGSSSYAPRRARPKRPGGVRRGDAGGAAAGGGRRPPATRAPSPTPRSRSGTTTTPAPHPGTPRPTRWCSTRCCAASPTSTTRANCSADTEFGTFEKVSDTPLTVKYTFNDKAVWSDGTPIDCADFLLGWAGRSGRYNKDGTVNQPNAVPAEPTYLFDTASTIRAGPDPEADLRRRRQVASPWSTTPRSSTGRPPSPPRPGRA